MVNPWARALADRASGLVCSAPAYAGSQSANVASIASRRPRLAGPGEYLVKPPMIPLILPGARILPDKSYAYRNGERVRILRSVG